MQGGQRRTTYLQEENSSWRLLPCSPLLPAARLTCLTVTQVQEAVRVMAKSMVRNRNAVNRMFQLKSQLQAVSLRISVSQRLGQRQRQGTMQCGAGLGGVGVGSMQQAERLGTWGSRAAKLAAAAAETLRNPTVKGGDGGEALMDSVIR